MHGHRVFIQYFALRDADGNYLGTIEFTGSAEPILQAYEAGGWADASSGASQADGTTGQEPSDADTGASDSDTPAAKAIPTPQPDAETGASVHPATGSASDAGDTRADADSGASQSADTGPFSDSGQAADGMTGASEY